MDYKSQFELYQSLIPVFKVKERIINNLYHSSITINDIWNYLAMNKWKYSYNLSLSDIVNDIITIDVDIIKK